MGNEFDELIDTLYDGIILAKREVDKIVQKGDLTPAELDSMHKITCMAKEFKELTEDEEPEYGYGYETRDMSMNRYANTSNGNGYSSRRGRSPVTGRYISRGANEGYSGHSIEDRMIMSLEQQMDSAQSDYERKLIEEEIRHIRNK